MIRYVAALLVAVLLPIQAYAAACAQICAASGNSHSAVSVDAVQGEAGDRCHEGPSGSQPTDEEGDVPHTGLSKCCQAHVFVLDRIAKPVGSRMALPAIETYAARWSSFIADEPSPPPIAFTAA